MLNVDDLPPTAATRLKLVKAVNHQGNDEREEEQIAQVRRALVVIF